MGTRKFTTTIASAALFAAILTGCSSGGSDDGATGSDVESTSDGIETTTTAAETTTTTDPGPQEGDEAGPDELAEAVVEGEFVGQRTIERSNLVDEALPAVGTTDERNYRMSTACEDGGSCTVTMVNLSAEGAETEFSFADGRFSNESSVPGDCRDETSVWAEGLFEEVATVEYAITGAEHRGGRWVATSFEGQVNAEWVVLDEARWAVEGCDWSTSDGAPGSYTYTITAALQD